MLSDEQYTKIKALCDVLQYVATEASHKSFKTQEITRVLNMQLQARPRLNINSTEELKILAKRIVMKVADVRKVRKHF